MRARLALTAALVALGAGGPSAHAWVTPPDREPPVIAASSATAPRGERQLVTARGLPAGWQGTRDRETGVVAELWGAFVPAPGAVVDPVLGERAARAFLAAHLDLLAPGAKLEQLALVANQRDGALRTVGFRQTWQGVPVVGAQLAVVIGHDRVFAATSQALPTTAMPAVIPPRGAAPIPTARALGWLRAATGMDVATRALGERVLLPVVTPTGDLAFRIADRIEVSALAGHGPGHWDVYIGLDGAPLQRASRLRFAASTLTYDVGIRYPVGPRHDAPAAQATITADGQGVTTGTDGGFAWATTVAAAVVPSLVGPVIQIVNQAGALATAALTAQPATPVRWSLAADEFGDAQLSAFIAASAGKVRARELMPSLAPWLDQPLAVYVNEDDVCNAYSTGDDIHFFRRGPACENTGRLADVVYHELGHSIHQHAIIPGVGAFNTGLSEGMSDLFAATIVEDPQLGRGFAFDDQAVRDIDPFGIERTWPQDRSGDPHVTGLIISGALWDLRKALIAELGAGPGRTRTDAIVVGVLQRAADLPGSYLAAQIADDDDGDLGNGTPHHCALEAAFGKHGLAGATFATTTVGVPVVTSSPTGASFTVPVTTPVNPPCPVPAVARVELRWRIGGNPAQIVAFAPSGTTWVGALPTQPAGTLISYQIVATLDDGQRVTYPANPADPEYQLYVGPVTEIWCERFDADPHWAQRGTQEWDWATPAPISLGGDPTTTHTGTHALGIDLTGDGRYAASATTSISTPAIDVGSYDQVHLQAWRWLTVEDALFDQATITVNGTSLWSNAQTASGARPHLDREWRFQDLDVTAYAGGPVTVAWNLTADSSSQLGGWTLDDVCLVGFGKHPTCGDGTLDDGEVCDDGNTTAGDGCSDTCTEEPAGGCCSIGADPAGPLLLGTGVLVLALRPRRRRS